MSFPAEVIHQHCETCGDMGPSVGGAAKPSAPSYAQFGSGTAAESNDAAETGGVVGGGFGLDPDAPAGPPPVQAVSCEGNTCMFCGVSLKPDDIAAHGDVCIALQMDASDAAAAREPQAPRLPKAVFVSSTLPTLPTSKKPAQPAQLSTILCMNCNEEHLEAFSQADGERASLERYGSRLLFSSNNKILK